MEIITIDIDSEAIAPENLTEAQIKQRVEFARQYAADLGVERIVSAISDMIGVNWGKHSALSRDSWVMNFRDRVWCGIRCNSRDRDVQLQVDNIVVFHSRDSDSYRGRELLKFRPGPWCDYLDELADEAGRRRQLAAIHASEAERIRLAEAFAPINL